MEGGWGSYEKLVLHELSELKRGQERLAKAQEDFKKEYNKHVVDESQWQTDVLVMIASLKIKTAIMWGAGGGTVVLIGSKLLGALSKISL